jgi:hypothetical protein
VATEITNEALLAACYIRARFYLDGKGDFICNQNITFIEKLFKEYPDQKHIQDLYRTAFDKVRDEQLPDDKWLHLVSIFQGYSGIITYPDLPEGTPVIIPSATGEDSLLSAVSRLPGAFLPREGSPAASTEPSQSGGESGLVSPGRNYLDNPAIRMNDSADTKPPKRRPDNMSNREIQSVRE